MISKKVESALNKQIGYEAYASSSYLAMASWSETQGLRGCAGFFYAQSDEERVHMLKIVRYINEAGGHALVPEIQEPRAEYKSLRDVFETSLKQELEVTRQINKLVELSFNAKDFASYHFLQWYVAEQVEEESQFNAILDIIKLAGDTKQSLLLVDKEIGALRGKAEAEPEE